MVRGYEIGRNPSVSKADVTDAIKRADSYNSYNGTDHRHYAGETTRNFRGHRKVSKFRSKIFDSPIFLNTLQSPIETGRTNFSIANTPKNVFAINPSNKRLSYTGRNRLQNQVERKIRSKTGSDGESFFPTFRIIKTLGCMVKVTTFNCGSGLTKVKSAGFCHITVTYFYVQSE